VGRLALWLEALEPRLLLSDGLIDPPAPPEDEAADIIAVEQGQQDPNASGPVCYTVAEDPEHGTIEAMVMASGPTPMAAVSEQIVSSTTPSAVILTEVPTSSWTYGCSATAAGMIFGYCDRIGYANMYTGPTNGGVAPLSHLGQGIGSTPIAGSTSIMATQNGFDGRATNGHVDDYWIGYGSGGPDPYAGNWSEHTWETCTADFMGTNQWKWDLDGNGSNDRNGDGATTLYSYGSATKLYDYTPPSGYGMPRTALCHGMRLFAESRGYTVVENYSQRTDNTVIGGFSFANYMAEIDAGNPVMIQVVGHSMVGVGYDAATQRVYLHDTWGDYTASMTWGEDYAGMDLFAVTVIHLESGSSAPTVGSLTDSPDPVVEGETLTLTAGALADPDGDVASVAFYRESNDLAGLQTGTGGDTLVGTDASAAGGWTATFSTSGLSGDTYTYYAQAIDSEGNRSASGVGAEATTNTVLAIPPAEIRVEGNGQEITDGDDTPDAGDGTDFGSVAVGANPVQQIFTVTNDGGKPLNLGTVYVPSGFNVTDGLDGTLAPGASDTFTVELTTGQAGARSGWLIFATNDADENPFNFTISGSVQQDPDWEPYVLSYDETHIDVQTLNRVTTVDVSLDLNDTDYRVTDWGTPIRVGNTFVADIDVEHWTGTGTPPAAEMDHTFDLGYLSSGAYLFAVTGWGHPVDGELFTVVHIITPAEAPFYEDWESGTFADCWEMIQGDEGRIQITWDNDPYAGQYHVTLDDAVYNDPASLNQLILHLDLEGLEGVHLSFANREWNDEDDSPDAVQLSVDGGATWHEIVALTGSNSTHTYTERTFDLDGLGLTYTDDTMIRFQQFDNAPIDTDGMAFDEIRVWAMPDLIATRFNADDVLAWGQDFQVEGRVFNRGDGTTGAITRADFYLSNNEWISEGDYYLGSFDAAVLDAHSGVWFNETFTMPDGPPDDRFDPTGPIYVGVVVDAGDAVEESREGFGSNRCRGEGKDQEAVWVDAPDLIATRLDSDEPLQWGEDFLVDGRVFNRGNVATHVTTHTDFYLSSNKWISPGDYYLGSFDAPALDAQTGVWYHETFTMPDGPPDARFDTTGRYWIGAIVDADDTVIETREGSDSNYNRGDDKDRDPVWVDEAQPAGVSLAGRVALAAIESAAPEAGQTSDSEPVVEDAAPAPETDAAHLTGGALLALHTSLPVLPMADRLPWLDTETCGPTPLADIAEAGPIDSSESPAEAFTLCDAVFAELDLTDDPVDPANDTLQQTVDEVFGQAWEDPLADPLSLA